MNGPHVGEFTDTIIVSGGVGAGTFTAVGKMWDIYIKPEQASTYDWTIVSASGVPRSGTEGMSGETVFDLGGRPCKGTNTINILNATNGTYLVVLSIEQGYS